MLRRLFLCLLLTLISVTLGYIVVGDFAPTEPNDYLGYSIPFALFVLLPCWLLNARPKKASWFRLVTKTLTLISAAIMSFVAASMSSSFLIGIVSNAPAIGVAISGLIGSLIIALFAAYTIPVQRTAAYWLSASLAGVVGGAWFGAWLGGGVFPENTLPHSEYAIFMHFPWQFLICLVLFNSRPLLRDRDDVAP